MVGVNKLSMIALIASLGIANSSGVRAMESEDCSDSSYEIKGNGVKVYKFSGSVGIHPIEKKEETLKPLTGFSPQALGDLDAYNKRNIELKEQLEKNYAEQKIALEKEYAEQIEALEKEYAEQQAALKKKNAKEKTLVIKNKPKHKKNRRQSGEG